MHFRLLGPLEVRFGDRPVLTGPKHRSLLAALLIDANRVQPVDHLIRVIWGDRPPSTARNLISVYVHQIRKAAREAGGHAGDELIVTQPPGYVVRTPDQWVDLRVFERMVAEATSVPALHDPARTSALLHSALGLWRGPALSDVPSQLLRDRELPRLEESRLRALETRIEADLALGRHAQLIGELEGLVGAHVFRERFYGQLMVALYRSGRRGEALHVYQRCRDVLVAELGMEPGPELRHLQNAVLDDRAVLRSDPVVARGDVVPIVPAPSQLAPAIADFTGRGAEVGRIEALLAGGSDDPVAGRVMVITGMPGVGKTALAIHVAWAVHRGYPDGRLHVDLRGSDPAPTDPADALATALATLGVERAMQPSGFDELRHLYRTVTAGRRMLVVLDDAATEAQVRPLLCTSPGSATIVTSRGRLAALESADTLRLDTLPAADSVRLLGRIVGTDRSDAEPLAIAAIAHLTGHLPLALRIAGATLAARPHWSVSKLAARLADTDRRLAELTVGDLSVEAAFRTSYLGLDVATRRLFRALGRFALQDRPVAIVGMAVGVDPAMYEVLLERLAERNLVELTQDESGQVRVRLPVLLRDFARARLAAEERGSRRAVPDGRPSGRAV